MQARGKARKESRDSAITLAIEAADKCYSRGFDGWREDVESWRLTIKNSKEFMFDDGISPLKIDESALPRHLEAPYVRLAKQIFHGCGNLAVAKCRYRRHQITVTNRFATSQTESFNDIA